ncbi:MAG: hypothetical protein KBG28_19275 [Kofleriaceae bacterium]|nr:hypothetical protein [Kofleriaceae bacterium]MBP6837921.1 hypothetical protein [Kofleriaceae bacterium]MBP9206124.1 hypothetical protein [Kofleriaceae bacterium]
MGEFFDEIKRYIGFTAEDAATLARLHAVLSPDFRTFAEHFYDVIERHPRARAVFAGPTQVERLKGTLVEWMESGLIGPHDERYYERRSRIGRRHVVIGLPQEYMFTAMNVLRLDFHRSISHGVADRAAACAATAAVDKLLDLELAIMLRHYQVDSEERLVARERRAQAEKLSAMQTLTAGLAHEVRNPLNSAKLQLELLERRLRRITDDPKLLGSSALVKSEIERLTELLNELLAFARPQQLSLSLHDLVSLLHQVIELERATATAKGVQLVLVGDHQPLPMSIDAGKVHQLVLNLVRNAIEAVGPGGHVEVEVALDEVRATIRIRDDGPGIPEEARARIYEPFFSTKESGTGMGMAIVHSLVSLHGGAIDFTTGPTGTEFVISLPR